MKEALLLIDIQDMYFTADACLLNHPEETAAKAAMLLEKFRKEGKPIIHVQHKVAAYMDIHRSVTPLPNEKVITKKYPSAFLQTQLADYLTDLQVDTLVICGMMSHMCVDTTVRACQDYGYHVILIDDACTTKTLEFRGKIIDAETAHVAYMAGLSDKFANIVTTEQYLNDYPQ